MYLGAVGAQPAIINKKAIEIMNEENFVIGDSPCIYTFSLQPKPLRQLDPPGWRYNESLLALNTQIGGPLRAWLPRSATIRLCESRRDGILVDRGVSRGFI